MDSIARIKDVQVTAVARGKRAVVEGYVDGDLVRVADVGSRPMTDMEVEAIARVMAAAPDLLEACRKANTCASLPDAVKDLVRAAIAKATTPAAMPAEG